MIHKRGAPRSVDRILGRPFVPLAGPGFLAILALLCLGSCASRGSVRSGAFCGYAPGLTVTLVSWKDGQAEYSGKPAEGRWLTTDIRVDYDGNSQYAEVPVPAFRVLWVALDGGRGDSAVGWVFDPTPGYGGAEKRAALRVRLTNRFTLAFDLPPEAVPVSLEVGGSSLPLVLPQP